MAARNWNPHEPYVLGLEWPGMYATAVPLSQDAEYGYTFESDTLEDVDTATFLTVEPVVSFLTVCTPLVTVYERGAEMAVGTPTSTIVEVNGGTLVGTAALGGGGASIAASLASPADDTYINIPAGAFGANEIRLEFATAGLFAGKRILELRVRYVATAMNLVENTAESVRLLLSDVATIGLQGLVPIERAGSTSLPVRVSSLGECNHVQTGSKVWPWTVTELGDFDTSIFDVRFMGELHDVHLHYAALEVVWCEENRVAVGGLKMRQGKEVPSTGQHAVSLRAPDGTDNWTKPADVWFTVTVCSSRSPGPFLDALDAIATLDMVQTQGPQPSVPMIDSFDEFVGHQGRVMARNASNVLIDADDDTRLTPIMLITTTALVTTDADQYDAVFAAPVYNGGPTQGQEIGERSGGSATYPWLTFYVRRIGAPAGDITVAYTSVLAVTYTTTVTEAEIDAAPEIFDGWRKVVHAWGAGPPVLATTLDDGDLVFSTAGASDAANRYELLGLNTIRLGGGHGAESTYTDYGGTFAYSYKEGGVARVYSDLVAMLHTAPAAVAGFAAAVASQTVGKGGGIGGTARSATSPCQVTRFDYVALSWTITSIPTAEFAYYEIQRKDTVSTTFATVATITAKATIAFFDVEARVAVQSTYRIRAVRVDGIASAWSSEVTATPTAGDTATNLGCGFLMFSSNEHTGYTCIFSDSYDGDPTGGFHFVEADEYALARHFGRDYTQGFHGTERGGVTFERTVVVNAVEDAVTWGDHDFDALRTIAYADLPYVCVKDDLGNRWYAVVQVPDASIRRPGSIELATVRVTEATGTPWPADDQFDL